MTKLITDEQRAQLLTNGRQSFEQENFDPAPVVKLFTPDAGATWLGHHSLDEFATFQKSEIDKWAAVVQAAHIKAE